MDRWVGTILLCKSLGIWDGIVSKKVQYFYVSNFVFEIALLTLFLVILNPDINPIYVGLGRSCSRDFKNESFVDVGLV